MRIVATLFSASFLLAVAAPLAAQTAGPSKADMSAMTSCLQSIQAEQEKYEKLSEKAREKADPPQEAASCIGAVSATCQEKSKGDENKALLTCNNREIAVWNAILEGGLKEFMKEAKPDEKAAMEKAHAAWQAYRDARCAFAGIDNKEDKGLAAALDSACRLDQTARHALWIDVREQ
ncbi:MAG: lysozyme inhibitor LprI family protein [Beijerinckiaceae bacterium]